jgi:hypothetical protein
LWVSLLLSGALADSKPASTDVTSKERLWPDEQEFDPSKVLEGVIKLQDAQQLWEKGGAMGGALMILTKIGELWTTNTKSMLLKDQHSVLMSTNAFHAAVKNLGQLKPGQLDMRIAEADNAIKEIWARMQYLHEDEQLYKDLLGQWSHYNEEWARATKHLEKVKAGLAEGKYISAVRFKDHTEIAKKKIGGGSLKSEIASKQNYLKWTAALSAGQALVQLWSSMSEASLAVSDLREQIQDEPLVLRQLETWNTDLQKFKDRVADLLTQEEVSAQTLRKANKKAEILMSRLMTWISEQEKAKEDAERLKSSGQRSIAGNLMGAGGAGYQMLTTVGVAGGITPVLQGVALGAFSVASIFNGVTTYAAQGTIQRTTQHLVAMKSARSELDEATSRIQELVEDEDAFDF